MRQIHYSQRALKLTPFLVMLAMFAVSPQAQAKNNHANHAFHKQMAKVVNAYLNIPKILAQDKTGGVQQAAAEVIQKAKQLKPQAVTGEHAKHYKKLPAKIIASAKKLQQANDIKAMRDELKALSKPMAMWVSLHKPDGISVIYCSMAPGSWLQKTTTVANPYYGAQMLRCGEIVGGEGYEKP